LSATALVALFPELEPLLGAWRRRYTGDGLRGMPPHVTLIFPFADSSEVDDLLEPLERVFAAFTPFEFALRQTARFPGLLYLRPEAAETFVTITEALVNAFPDFPPTPARSPRSSRTSPSRRAKTRSWRQLSESWKRSCR
jgi:2'-5' RNA ligase